MIEKITIENYKSIQELKLELGRITVLIGANGSGKSNILEAIALGSAALDDKLDNEFLSSRGIRVTDDPRFMRSAFSKKNVSKQIKISFEEEGKVINFSLRKNNSKPYSSWKNTTESIESTILILRNLYEKLKILDKNFLNDKKNKDIASLIDKYPIKFLSLDEFLIYSPENTALRTFEQEGQIQPLGIKGEGLFKLLKVLSSEKNKEQLDEIKDKLKFIDWFSDFDISQDLSPQERRIQIKDKYLDTELQYFDQKSSNEGFLFLLFYFCLFISNDTPKFFAIDNIDASLNPKLCSHLMITLTSLAKKYKKQVIFTTHNPAILDGINLDDEDQKLYVVYRNKLGQTRINNIKKPQPVNGREPIKLSESFLRGYLGGLPNNF